MIETGLMQNGAKKLGIKSIVLRKGLHFLIALTPAFSALNYNITIIFLCAGTIFYGFIESFRLKAEYHMGFSAHFAPLCYICGIIVFASHRRDKGRFVLGPLTLGAGALFSLVFFNEKAAAIAIYSLAAGDGLAGLVGRLAGRLRPRFLCGKSIEGSAACFFSILIISYILSGNIAASLACAAASAIIEALPIEDMDNILLPFTAGAVISIF